MVHRGSHRMPAAAAYRAYHRSRLLCHRIVCPFLAGELLLLLKSLCILFALFVRLSVCLCVRMCDVGQCMHVNSITKSVG